MINAKAGDIMSEHLVKTKEDQSVGTVAHLLYRHRINGIFIVDKNDENKLVGIFTTTDLLRILGSCCNKGSEMKDELKKVSDLPVGNLSSKEIVSLQKDTPITELIKLMHSKNVHTIPIYQGEKLVGVVGRHDILNISLNYW